jgi:hypothetical protein
MLVSKFGENAFLRALLALIVVMGFAAPGFAACPATNEYSYAFANQPAASLSYVTTYNYTGTNGLAQSQAFTIAFTTNGVATNAVGGANLPAINALINDGSPATANNLMIGGRFNTRTASITGATNVIVTTFTFPTPIRDFSVQLNDVDFGANQFRDWIYMSGANGVTTYTPSITTPFTNNNGTGPRSDANSTATLGVATTPYNQSAFEAIGTAASGNTINNGTVSATFAQPVTSVTIRYGNYPLTGTETATGVQAFGIQALKWCAMPSLTVVKSSTQYLSTASDPNRFAIPNSDRIYSITVSNSNASIIDAGVISITDILPAQMTLYNGDIDDAGPLTTNFELIAGSSGVSLAPANISYSTNAGTTYSGTATAGYNSAVNAIRFNPQGPMAANSSFTVRFRMKIK